MSLTQFFLGCAAPLFVGFYHVVRSYRNKSKTKDRTKDKSKTSPPCSRTALYTSHVGIVCELLQGPYKERQKHIWQRETQCCWTGVLFTRRLLLATVNTFVIDALTKMSLMTLIMFSYMIDTIYVKPCKGRLANLADISSSAFLVVLSVINLIKATFETARFQTIDGNVALKVMSYIENALTLYIPLIIAVFIVLLVIYRIIHRIYVKYQRYEPNRMPVLVTE